MIKGIRDEKVIERSETRVVLEVFIQDDCDYFDGHFPSFKLLPAVAEFTLVEKYARKYFGVSAFVSSIPRMKFSSPLLPNTTVLFSLAYNSDKKISFDISDSAHKKISSGSFCTK